MANHGRRSSEGSVRERAALSRCATRPTVAANVMPQHVRTARSISLRTRGALHTAARRLNCGLMRRSGAGAIFPERCEVTELDWTSYIAVDSQVLHGAVSAARVVSVPGVAIQAR